jgi:hypothetical protein
MTDTMTSQNIDLSYWDTLYIVITVPENVNANLMHIPYCLIGLFLKHAKSVTLVGLESKYFM